MKFRPCIDIHNGKVKQIVGGSLSDRDDQAEENFVSERSAADYARLYQADGLAGGHIILLNPQTSPYYEDTLCQARQALAAYPGGLQIGGGVNPENAAAFLDAGASHVIVTSYVFKDGEIHYRRLEELVKQVGRKRLVLDLSCRKKGGSYYVVTDRWQKFTQVALDHTLLDQLSEYCDEFLIHAVDVEGKVSGIEKELAGLLGAWGKIPMTYAGGVSGIGDIEALKSLGKGRVDVTVGSGLDLFGGSIPYEELKNLGNG